MKEKIIEIYQIVSVLCGIGLADLKGTNPVEEINILTEPMRKYDLEPYEKNPGKMTNWDLYLQKLKELIDELKRRGLI